MDSLVPVCPLILLQPFVLPFKGDLLFFKTFHLNPTPTPSQEVTGVGTTCSGRSGGLSRGTPLTSGEAWLHPGLLSPACASRCLPGQRAQHCRAAVLGTGT